MLQFLASNSEPSVATPFSGMTMNKLSIIPVAFTALLVSSVAAHAQPSRFTESQICRATVAAVMGRDPAIVKVERTDNGVVRLYYFRPDDGKRWDYRCKVEGQKVVWATAEGRWRTHSQDETIQFVSTGEVLTIEQRFTDGSKSTKAFTAKQLGS
jgi:hypothetical protein